MLTAKRHSNHVPHLIVVLSDEITAPGNVVAKHNTITGETHRTKHVGAKPNLSDIRAAIAKVS